MFGRSSRYLKANGEEAFPRVVKFHVAAVDKRSLPVATKAQIGEAMHLYDRFFMINDHSMVGTCQLVKQFLGDGSGDYVTIKSINEYDLVTLHVKNDLAAVRMPVRTFYCIPIDDEFFETGEYDCFASRRWPDMDGVGTGEDELEDMLSRCMPMPDLNMVDEPSDTSPYYEEMMREFRNSPKTHSNTTESRDELSEPEKYPEFYPGNQTWFVSNDDKSHRFRDFVVSWWGQTSRYNSGVGMMSWLYASASGFDGGVSNGLYHLWTIGDSPPALKRDTKILGSQDAFHNLMSKAPARVYGEHGITFAGVTPPGCDPTAGVLERPNGVLGVGMAPHAASTAVNDIGHVGINFSKSPVLSRVYGKNENTGGTPATFATNSHAVWINGRRVFLNGLDPDGAVLSAALAEKTVVTPEGGTKKIPLLRVFVGAVSRPYYLLEYDLNAAMRLVYGMEDKPLGEPLKTIKITHEIFDNDNSIWLGQYGQQPPYFNSSGTKAVGIVISRKLYPEIESEFYAGTSTDKFLWPNIRCDDAYSLTEPKACVYEIDCENGSVTIVAEDDHRRWMDFPERRLRRRRKDGVTQDIWEGLLDHQMRQVNEYHGLDRVLSPCDGLFVGADYIDDELVIVKNIRNPDAPRKVAIGGDLRAGFVLYSNGEVEKDGEVIDRLFDPPLTNDPYGELLDGGLYALYASCAVSPDRRIVYLGGAVLDAWWHPDSFARSDGMTYEYGEPPFPNELYPEVYKEAKVEGSSEKFTHGYTWLVDIDLRRARLAEGVHGDLWQFKVGSSWYINGAKVEVDTNGLVKDGLRRYTRPTGENDFEGGVDAGLSGEDDLPATVGKNPILAVPVLLGPHPPSFYFPEWEFQP